MKISRLQAFASLTWYEETIKFLFNFSAKTSEVLLAAGLVVSTANFLTDGTIIRSNGTLATSWAWAQALAIDSSFGVTFFYVCQCIKQRDWIKAVLYGLLTLLLAIVAGTITNIDTYSHAIHISIANATMQFGFDVKLLTTLRAITVVGFVMMSRLKNVSFTELPETPDSPVSPLPYLGSNQPHEPGAEYIVRVLPTRFTSLETVQFLKVLNQTQRAATTIPEEQDATFYRRTDEGAPSDEFGTSQEERDSKIESAFKELRAEGKRISGRALAARAHVHRTFSTRWLETYRQETAHSGRDDSRPISSEVAQHADIEKENPTW
jgi:hypothetical protein